VTERILQGRYQVERQLGAGGMGAVYRAVDLRFRNVVAVKESLCAGAELAKAFEREARLLRGLRHRRLPGVIDYFEDGGRWYLVMDYVPGEDMWEMMQRRRQPFPVADVLAWADQLLDLLEYLHGHAPPIVHRDVKPQNLKLTPAGDVMLLDFGLSKGLESETSRLAGGRSVQGYTPGFAPVEQILGQGTDPRSDLYSVGATMYCLLTGRMPVDAGTRHYEIHSRGRPDPLPRADAVNPAVPAAVGAAIASSMADSAAARPATAVGMRAMLRLAATGVLPQGAQTRVENVTQAQQRESTVAHTMVETAGRRVPLTAASSGPAPATPAARGGRAGLLVAALLLLLGGGAGLGLLVAYFSMSWDDVSDPRVTGPTNTTVPSNANTTNTAPPPPPPPSVPKLTEAKAASLCANILNTYECAKAIEKYQLGQAGYKALAARSGKSLELTLKNGGRVTLLDADKEADSMFYCLREYLPDIGYFVLHRQYYEGNTYLLVDDRQGRQFEVTGLPLVSPDRKRLVVASIGLDAAYSINKLTVLRLDEGGLETEATFDPQDWGPSDVEWVDGETIRFMMNRATDEPGNYRKTPARAIYSGGKWVLDATGV
jgi:serine/threonine protein kinase